MMRELGVLLDPYLTREDDELLDRTEGIEGKKSRRQKVERNSCRMNT